MSTRASRPDGNDQGSTTNASAQGPICIIGMHRSGTSMIANVLNQCGLDLGSPECLVGPNPDNPLGHFEPRVVNALNESLLARLGGAWDQLPDFPSGWEHDPALEAFREEARGFVSGFSSSRLWGWKEPRTTVLLPFWKALVPDLRFVICLRNPLDVAQSLSKRNGMSIERGVYLWGLYTEPAIRDTNGCPRVFTFYEDFFVDPVGEIKRLVEFCGLRVPDELSNIDDMVSRELKHHTSEIRNLLNEDKIPAEYTFLYMCLRSLSIEARSKELVDGQGRAILSENIAKLLEIFERFRDQNEAAHAYSELAYTRSLLNENTRLVVHLRKISDKAERELAETKTRLDQLHGIVDQLHGIVDSHEKTLEAIYSSRSWMLAQRLMRIVDRIIPPGTRARRGIVSFLKRRGKSG